jgi:hypothetical protein
VPGIFFLLGLLIAFGSCQFSGAARAKLQASPYGQIAVFPLERAAQTLPIAGDLTSELVERLQAKGFVVDEQMPEAKKKRAAQATTERVKGKGITASLNGILEEAAEREETIPPVYDYEPVPPPRCCSDAMKPCRSDQVFDDKYQSFVMACQGSHKRVVKERAKTTRQASLYIRVKLTRIADGKTLWEDSFQETKPGGKLHELQQRAVRKLADSLAAKIDMLPPPPASSKK